jgi:hypothetical protein
MAHDREPLPGLAEANLARTSGPPCLRVRERVCDFVDGTLDDGSAFLLAAHLAHCDACRALAEALRLASETLPAFGTMDPGPAFTGAVLARTSAMARQGAGPDAAFQAVPDPTLRSGPDSAFQPVPDPTLRSGPDSAFQPVPDPTLRSGPDSALQPVQDPTLRSGPVTAFPPGPWAPDPAPFDLRVRQGWHRLLRRPRFCLEAAYLCTAAGLMAVHLPVPRPAVAARVSLQDLGRLTLPLAGAGQGLAREGAALVDVARRAILSEPVSWGQACVREARTVIGRVTRALRAAWDRVILSFSVNSEGHTEPSSASPRSSR